MIPNLSPLATWVALFSLLVLVTAATLFLLRRSPGGTS